MSHSDSFLSADDFVESSSASTNIASSSDGASNTTSSTNALKRDLGEAGIEDESSNQSTKKTKHTISIPVHSSWFSTEEIHAIEKKALPEFFGEDKDPNHYKTLRNALVSHFRKNPDVYLSMADCKRITNADTSTIIRLYSFLEHWGLINYAVDPRNKPVKINQPLNNSESETQVHNYTTDGQSLTEKFYTFQNLPEQKKKEPKVTPPVSNWTDHEILRLLEGIEKFKDDWDSIAKHVQTRSKEECVLQFLQLPIEDEFLLEQEGLENTMYQDLPLPFADASNPIMHTVAFLSSTVSPSVAAAAAEAAMQKIKEQASSSEPEKPAASFDVTKLDVQSASSVALGAAAARAKEIATREERELQRLVAFVIEQQLKKLEKKIKYFEKLEKAMQIEREELEKARKELHQQKMEFKSSSSTQE
ncbi:hypothetical protein C9374_014519 [Naegleria lovaniensis]|uniref:Uncharacterized protein n=1 Tax=Naegleria lovaniensis TaxID=51637 RepID=A0AA88H0M3_NAELO|nr:uncharacterized protein C9374_014519 [Naegleria lovaniensis]KAG2389119.1 hypothetical protein C9374_014519 [Naegleria lovaniensis]